MGLFDIQRGAGMVGGIQRPPPVSLGKVVCRVTVFSSLGSVVARNIVLVESSHLIYYLCCGQSRGFDNQLGNTLITWKTEES